MDSLECFSRYNTESAKQFNQTYPITKCFSMKSRTKTWGNISPYSFCDTINGTVYDEIVHFWRNIFNVPSGRAGKAFIEELTIWIKQLKFEFGSKALKAFMVLPALILKAVRYF